MPEAVAGIDRRRRLLYEREREDIAHVDAPSFDPAEVLTSRPT
jgi:hypothetical protein